MTGREDIIDRLLTWGSPKRGDARSLMKEAAAEIESLRAQLAVSDRHAEKIEALLEQHIVWEDAPPTCIACEDNPKPPNIPCRACRRTTRWSKPALDPSPENP